MRGRTQLPRHGGKARIWKIACNLKGKETPVVVLAHRPFCLCTEFFFNHESREICDNIQRKGKENLKKKDDQKSKKKLTSSNSPASSSRWYRPTCSPPSSAPSQTWCLAPASLSAARSPQTRSAPCDGNSPCLSLRASCSPPSADDGRADTPALVLARWAAGTGSLQCAVARAPCDGGWRGCSPVGLPSTICLPWPATAMRGGAAAARASWWETWTRSLSFNFVKSDGWRWSFLFVSRYVWKVLHAVFLTPQLCEYTTLWLWKKRGEKVGKLSGILKSVKVKKKGF